MMIEDADLMSNVSLQSILVPIRCRLAARLFSP
eukprot:CAMPEP_0197414432 /NCGR_PEP_ID=MMETSP1170-20131217/1146_1 /TAXON_ID=54406 /ORGANISM="Sarcinochrysis sp, Strain CCMP770" /LENGTH=32 /DNA_ID= /DNA_START= /DNA_END= /DNA_ORIENTATION=